MLFGFYNYQYYCQEGFIPFEDVQNCEETLRRHHIIQDYENNNLHHHINRDIIEFLTMAIELKKFCKFIKH